ncbi:PqiA/YebS family transporter subunit [Vibrio sp. CAIM 722]|uniref:PqiA/YebS family transporter subunit n=1 Tax=Vibrio eleionomae TaxID=2653505 RepID=A0A7X4RWG0_9VIBR|nr:paraquat-inducible protein A [Vibrio eleionomae]MZI95302.1 PqiA/YebS family transporter subunit [Vibrio eleionomae]
MKKASTTDNSSARYFTCPHCDWVTHSPVPEAGVIRCQRCHHRLSTRTTDQTMALKWYSLSALLLLSLSVAYTFIGFSAKGIEHKINLLDTITVLIQSHFLVLAILIAIFATLPVVYLLIVIYVTYALEKQRLFPGLKTCLRSLEVIENWLMVDVFLVGILVALIKLHGMAEVEIGLSFWPFCGFVVVLVKVLSLCDRIWLWDTLFPPTEIRHLTSGVARTQGVSVCHHCGCISHGLSGFCPRCHARVESRQPVHQHTTVALLLASCVLFFPANLYPIMDTSFLGSAHHSTILGGVILLWSTGSFPIALVVFIASIFVPIFKILLLSWLCWQSRHIQTRSAKQLQHFYLFTEFIGRWSMIDIFVVAVLSALVQLGGLMRIIPGPAIMAFAAVVVLTMLAAQAFDPRIFWDQQVKEIAGERTDSTTESNR